MRWRVAGKEVAGEAGRKPGTSRLERCCKHGAVISKVPMTCFTWSDPMRSTFCIVLGMMFWEVDVDDRTPGLSSRGRMASATCATQPQTHLIPDSINLGSNNTDIKQFRSRIDYWSMFVSLLLR